MSQEEENNVVSKLLQEMNQYNMILYVGTGAKAEELSEEVCKLTWRCVVTSQKRSDFEEQFTSKKTIIRYTQYSDLPSNIFNKDDLPLIQIYGCEGKEDSGIDDLEEDRETAKLKRQKDAERIIGRLFRRMDVRCKMVVIGYNPDDPNEFPFDDLRVYLTEIQGAEVSFFGIDEEGKAGERSKKLVKFASDKGYFCSHCSLSEIIARLGEEAIDFGEGEQLNSNQSLFYKGKKPVSIDNSLLLRCRNFAQLLTVEAVNQIRPSGRIQQSLWFYNFLSNSSEWPQWYGYLPESDFHLKRDFEDPLVNLVRDIIAGKKERIKGVMPAVILEGDPGSSKSITLGALAYRIFNEKINPVVYIKNDDLLFNSANSTEFEQLDELLQVIEDLGEKDVRTLILWDSATYRDIINLASDLVQRLDNRGRKFVLVCTAYRGVSQNNNKDMYQENKNEQIARIGRFYFLQSTRNMSDSEIIQLKNKAKLFLNKDQNTFDKVWGKLEKNGNKDIFNYFYVLVDLIRPNLKKGLSNENKEVNSYVNRQLVLLGAREQNEDRSGNSLYQALKKAGIPLSEERVETLEKSTKKTLNYDLDKFNTCIALFSQFKLDVPYTLGIHMLCANGSHGGVEFYQNNELFQLITTDIPWIYYGENSEGKFVFKFRNSLEAELFLDRNGIEAEQQIDMVCEMLDYFAEIYQEEGFEDEDLMYSIQRLIRMLGPNTVYQQFLQGGARETEHVSLLRDSEKIIRKLSDLREEYGIPDEDAEFATIEITFSREFYGKLWNGLHNNDEMTRESYLYRMDNLSNASNLALEEISLLEKRRLQAEYNVKGKYTSRINALSVEMAYCNIELEKLKTEYNAFCAEGSKSTNDSKKFPVVPYEHCFQDLERAIMTDPFNGYTYNALFSLFENEYKKFEGNEEKQLQLLSEVQVYADDVSTLEINSRGMGERDELSEHIGKIMEYSDGFEITIDDVTKGNHDSSFTKLFDQLLEKNNASGIIFVCQRELDKAGLGYKKQTLEEKEELVLTIQQIDICKKILDFMKREEYESCINNNAYALYLMLQVTWMFYNKRPINTNQEAQLTYIDFSGWREISLICEQYTKCCGENRRPIVILIQALALLHLDNDYIKAYNILLSLNENQFGPTKRMRVPYLFCDEKGAPYLYRGTVLRTKQYTGYIQIGNIPKMGTNQGIRFSMNNLGLRSMPKEKEVKSGLELGLGYTGFSLYTEEGRRLKEGY